MTGLLEKIDALIETEARLRFSRERYDEADAAKFGLSLLRFFSDHGVDLRTAVAAMEQRSER